MSLRPAHPSAPRPTTAHSPSDAPDISEISGAPTHSGWTTWHRPLLLTAALLTALTAVCAIGLAVDDRTLTGAPIWLKPFKFSVSFLIYALSLAWMLSRSARARRLGHGAGTVVAAAVVVEMAIIVTQTVRGRRSHFNTETPLDSTLFTVMGNTIVVLWAASLVVAVLLIRSPLADRAGALALRLGALIALAGAALGFLMTRSTPGQRADLRAGEDPTTVGAHSVGVPDGGPSMPLTGWSTTGGDLRIPHFVGLHALQLLPLLAFGLTLLAARLPRLRAAHTGPRLVLTAGAAYAALVALTTWQALRGQPLTDPDGATLGALAAIVTATAAGVLFSLRAPARRSAGRTAP
ncbi:hypothetical protein [Streptomyces clavuligerus]|uniref:Putative membrane protein n=1 Tax=Streptomyces clavuligerus TaxID=1901 RepID=E2PW89_STRCL|nr:hypothetical protein [Streptomyces clavuligerus]ANW21008.1 hypothetical protein BB341_23735 [Streptomyces clavuligerus]AXU15625.1 hypothetical protein D1794_24665 [Streptomyces clavuligerus]EFG05922.1 Putative membrane protein [Streptomyces clavuligerus]MBY6305739.1 hypothetical protein [Streptomyces clavuligerus]QCS08404.1 hypothetical protein CRV15_24030 [Streptomyces clavuligerus]